MWPEKQKRKSIWLNFPSTPFMQLLSFPSLPWLKRQSHYTYAVWNQKSTRVWCKQSANTLIQSSSPPHTPCQIGLLNVQIKKKQNWRQREKSKEERTGQFCTIFVQVRISTGKHGLFGPNHFHNLYPFLICLSHHLDCIRFTNLRKKARKKERANLAPFWSKYGFPLADIVCWCRITSTTSITS